MSTVLWIVGVGWSLCALGFAAIVAIGLWVDRADDRFDVWADQAVELGNAWTDRDDLALRRAMRGAR